MAKIVSTVVTDDLDGSAGAGAVSFGLDGMAYEMDLAPANRERLQNLLQPFMDGGRRIGRGRPTRTPASRLETAKIRAWAMEQGLDVAERGRISGDVASKYKAAH